MITLFLLFLYILYLNVFYNNQKKKIKKAFYETKEYKPYIDTMNKLVNDIKEYHYNEISIRTKDHKTLYAKEYIRSNALPIAILFHGYKGRALVDFSGGLKLTLELGFDAIVVDQRGHGKSDGRTISFGVKESNDVCEWINYVKEKYPNREIILEGISMGASTVLMSLKKINQNDIKYVIADCPFSSPKEIIQSVMKKRGFPVKLLYPFVKLSGIVFGHFNIEANDCYKAVKEAKVPILLIHGDNDKLVPVEMSERIKETNKEYVDFVKVSNAPHGLSFVLDYKLYKQKALDMKNSYLKKDNCFEILNGVFYKDGKKNVEDLLEYSKRNYYQEYIYMNDEVVAFLFYAKGNEKITSNYQEYNSNYMKKIIYNTNISKKYLSENDIYISLVAVRRNMQNMHLGSKLFKEVIDREKPENILLWADNTCNKGYYEHNGYKEVKKLHTNAIIYKKPLK